MNAARLLEHFERISDAADAVPRLRRFVLDLAVRGKLSAVEKTRPTKMPPSAAHPSQREHERAIPFEIPSDWVWAPLNQIGRLSGGMTPAMARADFWGGGIVWLSPKDIKADEVFASELTITHAAVSETNLTLYPPGSLFIVARSGILKRTLPVAINRVAAAANQDMKVLVPSDPETSRFIQIMLRGMTPFVLANLVKTGTTVQSLKYREFETQLFPLPPLAEQQRIVAKVDELMALCDRLEAAQAERKARRDRLVAASLARVSQPADDDAGSDTRAAGFHLDHFARLTTRPEHVKHLRQTILNLAVRGRLVPQDPADESADTLLDSIASPSTSTKSGRPKDRSNGISAPPYSLPNSWAWTPFGSLIVASDSGWSPKTEGFPRIDTNWGVLKVSAVSWDVFLAQENKQLLPGVTPPERAVVNPGDFLISRANTSELIAKCVVVEQCPPRLIMSDKIVRLTLSDHVEKRFLFIVNNYADHARRHYAENATGTSLSMKNVSRDVIYSLPIPLPPLAEQRRIVAKVDELMALCDQLEASLAAAATDRARLLESLLHEALAPAA